MVVVTVLAAVVDSGRPPTSVTVMSPASSPMTIALPDRLPSIQMTRTLTGT